MSTIVYIGNFGFPDKNASGKRVLANCLCLQKIGFRTVCIGPGNGDTISKFNVDCFSVRIESPIKRVISNDLFKVFDLLLNEHNEHKITAVILYGALFTQLDNLKIIKWCKNNSIKVIYDQVDWFELNWRNPLRAFIRFCNNNLMNNFVIPRCDGVICISDYLANYHKNKGCKTIIIPPLNMNLPVFEKTTGEKDFIVFAYAGTSTDIHRPVSQWKDRIDLFLEALSELVNCVEVRGFQVNVYGFTLEQYINMFPRKISIKAKNVIDILGERVIFHGNVTNNVAMDGIKNADFSFLIRNKKRSTMAGFPTKVSESIGLGTPVICNDTSDLATYITSGFNGILISLEEIKDTLKRVLMMKNDDILLLKKGCLENPFYYLNYTEKLEKWLNDTLI